MVINKDFKEFIELLNANRVKYPVIGGYAVNFHGYPYPYQLAQIFLFTSHPQRWRGSCLSGRLELAGALVIFDGVK
jgi:hypothetical protein